MAMSTQSQFLLQLVLVQLTLASRISIVFSKTSFSLKGTERFKFAHSIFSQCKSHLKNWVNISDYEKTSN